VYKCVFILFVVLAVNFQPHPMGTAWSLVTANAIFFHNPDVCVVVASGLA
jgi:hypothetical protein